ncbi:short transient receptor potential channel 3-like [Lingula anatina]|uniref:Short transient receptor potential channel 3-like n=1 Tax=Lingula anatina TaxID=7574 RepID=A0A1S3IIF0_LINAN|nr:short transient receptor potential channel 3-like [Lingula anatina]|eukprot:XP_013398015.1 short transient receptor potential channel 3-like [Lingula anatina]
MAFHGRLDSSTNRVFQEIFAQRYQTKEVEAAYLKAAETGDLLSVISFVVDSNVNINCVDFIGRSALELAVENHHLAIIQYLFPKCSLECAENALLLAVDSGNVQISEILLEHPSFKHTKVHVESGPGEGIYRKTAENYRFAPEVTPIILAALKNDYYITQLLLSREFRITTPHVYFCECTSCSNMRRFDSVKYSRSRLNTYKALASPAYLTLSGDDPIFEAFQLSHELEHLASVENEYKSQYLALSDQCKDYAVEFLDLCRTNEEVMAILNGDVQPGRGEDDEMDDEDILANGFVRLKMALKYEQKRFIAHAACQRQLSLLWYSYVPWVRYRSQLTMMVILPLIILIWPIACTLYILCPLKNKFTKIMRSPFVKFVNHGYSYFMFLLLIFIASMMKGHMWTLFLCEYKNELPAYINLMIFMWVLGMLWYECNQVWSQGLKEHFKDWWNWMDMTLLGLYIGSYALQLAFAIQYREAYCLQQRHSNTASYDCAKLDCLVEKGNCSSVTSVFHAKTGYVDPNKAWEAWPDPRQLADVLYALANVMSFTRTAYLLPANEYLGPLQISYGKMLQDTVKFFVVIALVFITFMVGLTSLYQVDRCENKAFTSPIETFRNLFWATFGMGNIMAPEINDAYVNYIQFSYHKDLYALTEGVGYVLYSLYIIAVAIVLLNMLIAMMSNTFEGVYNDSDVEWKFSRAELWMTYVKEYSALPPPFNILPTFRSIIEKIRKACRKMCCKCKSDDDILRGSHFPANYRNRKFAIEDNGPIELSSYKRILKRLIRRFIYKKLYDTLEQDEGNKTGIAPDDREDIPGSSVFVDITSLREGMWKISEDITYIKSGVQESIDNVQKENKLFADEIKTYLKEKKHQNGYGNDIKEIKQQVRTLQAEMSELVELMKAHLNTTQPCDVTSRDGVVREAAVRGVAACHVPKESATDDHVREASSM